MSAIRKHTALTVTVAVAAFLVLLGVASAVIADRVVAAAPAADAPEASAADETCEETAVAPPSGPKKPCKGHCPDKPYCTCTYNGQPRTSCEPCCYQTYTGVICLD